MKKGNNPDSWMRPRSELWLEMSRHAMQQPRTQPISVTCQFHGDRFVLRSGEKGEREMKPREGYAALRYSTKKKKKGLIQNEKQKYQWMNQAVVFPQFYDRRWRFHRLVVLVGLRFLRRLVEEHPLPEMEAEREPREFESGRQGKERLIYRSWF